MPRLFQLVIGALLSGAALFLGSSAPARAELRACNQTGDIISVAIGYSDNGVWTSEGWWTMRSGDCKTMVTGDLKSRYYYWRATQNGAPFPTEDYYFCTSAKVFTIAGDTDCEARGYDRVGFSQVDTGDAKEYTIEVTGTDPANDDLADIRAAMQGDWYAEKDTQFLAFIEGDTWTIVNHGEQLDDAKFEIAYTCPASEGDGPVILFDFPGNSGPPDCWLLVNISPDRMEIYVYSTGEDAVLLRQ